MASYKLHDGREVPIDPFVVTRKEFKQLTDPNSTADDAPIVAKATGLAVEEFDNMLERDWRGLSLALVKAVIAPDPT